MIFPKSIQIAGQTIRVIIDKTFLANKEQNPDEMIGYADYAHQVIIVDPSQGGPDFNGVIFFHEVVHWIFYILEEHDLRKNERLVNMFAHMLYQVMKPMMVKEKEVLVVDTDLIKKIDIKLQPEVK